MTICFACVEYFTLTAFSDRQLQLVHKILKSGLLVLLSLETAESVWNYHYRDLLLLYLIHERLQNNFRAHNTLIFHSESTSDAHEGQQQTNMHQTLTYNILQTMWRGCFSAAQTPTSLSTHLHMQLHMQEFLISSVFQSENLLNSSSNFTQLA